MVFAVANPCRFEPITSAKMDELLHAQKAIHEVVREWCKNREPQPLSKSIWASAEMAAEPEDSAVNAVNQPAVNQPAVNQPAVKQPAENQPAEGLATNSLVKKVAAAPIQLSSLSGFGSVVYSSEMEMMNDVLPLHPAAEAFRGVRPPEEFMASWRAMQVANANINLSPNQSYAVRGINFKNVPSWAKMNDMLCLVHGGDIERIWSDVEGEVKVQFLESEVCRRYHEAYLWGIRIGNHVIRVEKLICESVSAALRSRIYAGNTRVVYVDIPDDKTIKQLEAVTEGLELDHMVYHLEHGKPHRAYYFFCKIEDGHAMMRRLLGPEWIGTPANFLPDPCGLATGFHSNGMSASPMLSAVAAERDVRE